MGALSNQQKFYLSKDARRAWEKVGRPGNENDWRREQVKIACGCNGLREASNSDYLKIKAHFEALAGETDKAFESAMREQDEPIRQQRHVLAKAVMKAEVTPAYAEEIAQDRFKKTLTACNADELLAITKTIRARANKREGNHRDGFAPARRDKKRKPAEDTNSRMPALRNDDDINAELSSISNQ